jgi:hypothetical protein
LQAAVLLLQKPNGFDQEVTQVHAAWGGSLPRHADAACFVDRLVSEKSFAAMNLTGGKGKGNVTDLTGGHRKFCFWAHFGYLQHQSICVRTQAVAKAVQAL